MAANLKKLSIILGFLVVIVSFIIHMPLEMQELLFGKTVFENVVYSDILGVYRGVFMNKDVCENVLMNKTVEIYPWLRIDSFKSFCINKSFLPILYIDYYLKTPPLSSFLFWLITIVEYAIGYFIGLSIHNVFSTINGLSIFYITYSLLMSLFYFLTIRVYRKILVLINYRGIFAFFSFMFLSFIVYLIYSWEIVFLYVVLLSIKRMLEQKFDILTYLLLGLSASINYIGWIIVIYLLYAFLTSRKPDMNIVKGLAIGLLPYLIVLIVNPIYLSETFNYFVSSSYCNNCIYLLTTIDPWSQYMRAMAFIVIVSVLTIIFPFLDIRSRPVEVVSILLVISITLSLEFPPQSFILIAPLLPIYLYHRKEKFSIIIADLLNALIIILWFKDLELRKLFGFLDLPIKYSPQTLDSPVQLIAQTRNVILIIIFIIIIHRLMKNNFNKDLEIENIYEKHLSAGVA